ncbi:hypothetical protein ACEPAF_7089 [Sanghuangporus sanghuang]
MGQTSSTPSDRWPYLLNFTSDIYSIANNTLTCEELGIRYRIYTPPRERILTLTDDRITSIYRLDHETQREILVAQLDNRSHKRHMRIAPGTGLDAPGLEAPFVRVKEYFPNVSKWGTKRGFRASNGREYFWRIYDGRLHRSDDKSEPIAKFSEARLFGSPPMHIKLTNECLDILDEIVVTCLIAEQKRRDQTSQSAGASAGAASASAAAAAAAA